MALYAIGDVHACLPALNTLLADINFHPEKDRLWFVGDFINRGPNPMETLHFIRNLGDRAIIVLGNHEGRAIASLSGWHDQEMDSFLQKLKADPDATALENWLRNIPLFHHDKALGICMVHAGLAPAWHMEDACRLSDAVGQVLRDPEQSRVFFQDQGGFDAETEPPREKNMAHLRFAFSIMTRIRMCTREGNPLWPHHPVLAGLANPYAFASSESRISSYHPWFELRPKDENVTIVYGHWAAAGLNLNTHTWGLDSGCVYGGYLTAIRLDHPDHPMTQVPCEPYITLNA